MSLQAIRDLRMQRQKPHGVISVVVGRVGKLYKGAAEVIELPPGCQPRLMDWRPIVGCWVSFYHLEEDCAVMDAAFDMASEAGAKLMGYADHFNTGALCTFANPEDEKKLNRLLLQGMDLLCR